MAAMPTFIELLKLGGKGRPKQDVLAMIRASYASEVLMSIDNVDSAVDLYERVCSLPSTFTKAIVQQQGDVSINGPLPNSNQKLLTGRRTGGQQIVAKLLVLDFDDIRPLEVRRAELSGEARCCMDLAVADHSVALVPHEVVRLDVTADMISQTRRSGAFAALLMPRYLGSVARGPSCSAQVVTREGRRMIDALRFMHRLGYVHMDVKGDNVFFDVNGVWFLGDFGSACKFDSPIRSSTEGFYHSPILRNPARPKYDWFMLLVMLLIELGNKEEWAKAFIEKGNHVSEARIIAEAQRIIADTTHGQDLKDIVKEIMDAYASDDI